MYLNHIDDQYYSVPDEVLPEVKIPLIGEVLNTKMTKVVMNCCQDNINMTLLGVKWIPPELILFMTNNSLSNDSNLISY